jgi:hypothetical protein
LATWLDSTCTDLYIKIGAYLFGCDHAITFPNYLLLVPWKALGEMVCTFVVSPFFGPMEQNVLNLELFCFVCFWSLQIKLRN